MDSFRSGFKFSRGQGCFSQSAESLGKVKKSVKTVLKLEVNLIGERERELLFSSGCRKNAKNYLKRRKIIKLRNLTNSFLFLFLAPQILVDLVSSSAISDGSSLT